MSSPVVAKEFLWKFRDEITQGVAKARQAIQQGADEVREEGSKVANTGEDWKKMGTDAKEAAQETSQSLDSMKEKLLSYQHAATDASKNIREQFNESKQVLNGIPKQKTVSIKAQIDSNKLKSFSRKIHDVPEQKSTWLKIKDGFSNQMNKAQRQSKNTQKAFSDLKGTMAGTFVGGAVLGGIYAIGNGLKEATAAGMQFDTEQQKMQQTWLTLTNSKNAAKGMVDTINDLSVKTGQSRDLVNELEQGFYHLHSSKEESDAMTKSMLNMGDAVGLTSDQMKQVEQDMVHGLATGKVTQGELNQIGMYFPMIDEAMAKHFHTSVRGMREMAHAGKISGKDLEEVFEQLGSGKYEKAADNMMQSMWGMERTIKTQTPALIGAFEKPFFNMKNPFYAAVSKWMLDPATQKSFENAGKTMSKAIGDGLSGFSNFMKNMSGINRILGALIKNLGSGAWTGFKLTLEVIAEAFSLIGKAVNAILNPLGKATKGIKGIGILATPIKAVGVAMGVVGAMATTYAVGLAAYKTAMLAAAGASKVFEAAMKALDVVMDLNPIGIAIVVIGALIAAFVLAYKHCKTFRDGVNKAFEWISKSAKSVLNFFKNNWKELLLFIANPIVGGFALAYKNSKSFRSKINSLAKGIKDVFTGKAGWEKDLKKNFSNMQKEYQKYSKNQTRLQQREQKEQQKRWDNFWSGLTKKSRNAWNDLKKHTQNGVENIRKSMQSRSKSIEKTWNNTWSTIGRFTQNAWKNIKNYASSGVDHVHDAISGGLNTINRIWSAGWNSFTSFFRGIWNGIKQAAQDGMNGVISVINAGISGINKVWSFFTGHGTGLKELGKVHFAQGGTVHRHLSVINDGDGPDWKELVQTPDGNLFMSQERNWTGFLPEGTRVYSGAETRQIMNAVGVSHYATGGIVGARHFADGGIIGEGIDWAKGSLENIGSWLGDKIDAIMDFLDDPLKSVKGLLKKATAGMTDKLGHYGELATGALNKLTQPIADWFKKNLEPILDKLEEANPGGAGVERWRPFIRRAAKMEGIALTPTMMTKMLTQINTESKGNPGAIGGTDGLADGRATGLLQFKPGTFRSWVWHGHGNIMNGFDQILAAFNALQHGGEGGWGAFGIPGRGWATGGEITSQQFGWVGDNPEHHEFVLNPYAVSAEPLLDRAFEATAQAQPANSSTGNGNSKLDQMIDLLEKVLVAIESQETDVYLDGEKITDNSNKRNAKNWSLRKGTLS